MNVADSRRLAESLVAIGNASGVQTEALITAMDAPLGSAVFAAAVSALTRWVCAGISDWISVTAS